MPPLVISGTRMLEGHAVAYDIFLPPVFASPSAPPPSTPLPAAILVHGFGGEKKHMLGHAQRLAAMGMVVMTPNMSSLMKPSTTEAQERNIRAAAAHVALLTGLPSSWRGGAGGKASEKAGGEASLPADAPGPRLVDPSRVFLFGHSAGGAVVFEAAIELAKAKAAGSSKVLPPACVVLLDGVPWPRSIAVARDFPVASTALVSIRSEPSAWNMKAEIVKALAGVREAEAKAGPGGGAGSNDSLPSPFTSGVAGASRVLDFLIKGSGHGDPVDPKGSECFLKMMGLLGPAACWGAYEDAIVAVGEDALRSAAEDAAAAARADADADATATLTLSAVSALVKRLEGSGAVVVAR